MSIWCSSHIQSIKIQQAYRDSSQRLESSLLNPLCGCWKQNLFDAMQSSGKLSIWKWCNRYIKVERYICKPSTFCKVEQAKIWDATLEERTLHMEWTKWDYYRGFSISIVDNSNCKGVGERNNNKKLKIKKYDTKVLVIAKGIVENSRKWYYSCKARNKENLKWVHNSLVSIKR